ALTAGLRRDRLLGARLGDRRLLGARLRHGRLLAARLRRGHRLLGLRLGRGGRGLRSEEHTSELQSRFDLVCRLLLEKKKYYFVVFSFFLIDTSTPAIHPLSLHDALPIWRSPPGFGATGFSAPGLGTAGFSAPGFGTAGFSLPGFGAGTAFWAFASAGADGAWGAEAACGAASLGCFAAGFIPGLGAPDVLEDAAGPLFFAEDSSLLLTGSSWRRRRATGASMVEEAERTNSP